MKKIQLCFLGILMTLKMYGDSSCCSMSKNTWIPRSFGSYMSRSLFLEQPLFYENNYVGIVKQDDKSVKVDNVIYKNMCKNKCSETVRLFSVAFEYMQNFGQECNSCKNLGAMPFWSGTNVLTVGNNDGDADFDAYQLGLGDIKRDSDGKTILGSISLDPKVKHVGAEAMLYFSKYPDKRGIFCKINVPLGAMIIEPNLKEIDPVMPDGETNYTQTTDNPASSSITYNFIRYPAPADRHESIVDVFLGASSNTTVLDGNVTKIIRLRKGRIVHDKQEVIRLGDIAASFGYNLFANDKGFLGLAFKVSCPTGNVPNGDYMLEPIFGRAGLWGIGAEILSHYRVWQSDEKYLDLALQSELLTLRTGRTPSYRSFDLKRNGPGSKYLLIQHYPATYTLGVTAGNPTFDEIRVGDHIQPAVNLTTLPVISDFSIEGSLAFNMTFYKNNWSVGLGLEAWGRSEEKLSIDSRMAIDERFPNLNDYAVLGRQLSSYNIKDQGLLQTNYCEPLARINESQDPVTLVGSVTTVTKAATLPTGIADARLSENRIPARLEDALDICGAQAKSVATGKISTHFNYMFSDSKYDPCLGFMLGVEFTGSNTNDVAQYWSLALKGSLLF